jgi:hypothetical protein
VGSTSRKPRPQRKRPQCQVEFNNWVRNLSIPWAEKSFLFLLTSYVDTDDSGICWPTQSELSEVMGVTERTVRNLTRRLEARNLVYVEHRFKRSGVKLHNAYHVDPNTDPTLKQTVNGRVSTEVVQNFDSWFAAHRSRATGNQLPDDRKPASVLDRKPRSCNRTIGPNQKDQKQRERQARTEFLARTGMAA